VDILESRLALYTKLPGGRCLTDVGREGGSGLSKTRWVVERSLSWLQQFRRLRVRGERRADMHQAFLSLACIVICCDFAVRLL